MGYFWPNLLIFIFTHDYSKFTLLNESRSKLNYESFEDWNILIDWTNVSYNEKKFLEQKIELNKKQFNDWISLDFSSLEKKLKLLDIKNDEYWENKVDTLVKEIEKKEKKVENSIKTIWDEQKNELNKEYKLIIDVEDIDKYKEHDEKFQKYFNFFNQDFNLAMSCVKSKDVRRTITDFKKCNPKITDACTFGFNRELKARIEFIQSHPKKTQLAKKILEKRKEK